MMVVNAGCSFGLIMNTRRVALKAMESIREAWVVQENSFQD